MSDSRPGDRRFKIQLVFGGKAVIASDRPPGLNESTSPTRRQIHANWGRVLGRRNRLTATTLFLPRMIFASSIESRKSSLIMKQPDALRSCNRLAGHERK